MDLAISYAGEADFDADEDSLISYLPPDWKDPPKSL
jgi:hypothetical protein